ncbi:MAG: arylsulfatase [Pirellulales bacterium]|nr:arylsulfatase [Pirellulales bacterium]
MAFALAALCLTNLAIAAEPTVVRTPGAKRPNVVLIITDDQGWGDLGCHGNERIRTPHLDRLATDGLEMTRFYVSPVCAPTRASLLTGRYNYRTGVVDTYRGRAMMHADEVTLAEMLSAAGYRTGIFGKWHLGDNYPLRACDQGFAESLVHGGGGIVQAADPPQGNHYQDPWLWRNGHLEQTHGYCSDVYTDAAIDFIEHQSGRPFFAYLAFNCPHLPLEVRAGDDTPYRAAGLDDVTAKVYGMVTNIDENIGRLLDVLDEARLADDTIVIFLTDNGPQQDRYNGQMRGRKSSVYDGGIRVPLLVRWPGRLERGRKLDVVAAHIDITPTLLAACDVAAPSSVRFDGLNLLPLWTGNDAQPSALPDRTIFIQTHRGDVPELGRNCTAIGPRWKLVQGVGWREGALADREKKFELFDLLADPREEHDRATAEPTVLADLKRQYEAWFHDVEGTRHFAPPRILVGTPRENPTLLTRQECRGDDPGHWLVEIAPGHYDIKLIVAPAAAERTATISLPQSAGEAMLAATLPANATEVLLARGVELVGGPFALAPYIESRAGARTGVRYLEIHRTDLPAE